MSTLPLTQAPADPNLKDVLDQLKRNIFLNLACHHVGTVQSFDKDKQTATATINYKKTRYRLNSSTETYQPVLIDYPILADCPVVFLGGGKSAMTFPVAKGDECLVLFNDRDIDNWFKGGNGAPVATPRAHSISDGIILVGVRSLANVLTSFDDTRAVLRNDKAMVGVGASLVKIANDQYTLNTLLQNLVTEIKNLVTATAAITVTGVTTGGGISGPPANAAVIAAISATLTTTATQIAGLLE